MIKCQRYLTKVEWTCFHLVIAAGLSLSLTGCDNEIVNPTHPALAEGQTDDCKNRCAVDPLGDLLTLDEFEPGYALRYPVSCEGSDSAYVYPRPNFLAATRRSRWGHRQGIQRINRDDESFLVVSYSKKNGHWRPKKRKNVEGGFEVVDVSEGSACGPVGASANASTKKVTGCMVSRYADEDYGHYGGMTTYGRWLVAAVEDRQNKDVPRAGIRLFEFGDPRGPVAGEVLATESGKAATASLVRLTDGRYLAAAFTWSQGDFFMSTSSEMSLSASDWTHVAHIDMPSGWREYDGLQFVSACDGRLFAVATDNDNGNKADVWRVTLDADQPHFEFELGVTFDCGFDGKTWCNFDAGAGLWVDDRGRLSLYSVEHFNDGGKIEGIETVKVREFSVHERTENFVCPSLPDCSDGDCGSPAEECGPEQPWVPGAPPISSGMIDMGDYWIDAGEVEVGAYRAFLSSSATPAMPAACEWKSDNVPEGWDEQLEDSLPVVGVDWCDAWAYCHVQGKRMCGAIGGQAASLEDHDASNNEWFQACGGPEGFTYPYGDNYSPKACNGADLGLDAPLRPGALSECRGNKGLYDMSGNVWEWTNACSADSGAADQCRRRGGSYFSDAHVLRCALNGSRSRNHRSVSTGIRCCSD